MEIRVAIPIVLGLASIVIIVFAEFRLAVLTRKIAVFTSIALLVWSIMDFKDLEKRYEQYFLLRDFGQTLFGVHSRLSDGRDEELESLLLNSRLEKWWHKPDRSQVWDLRESMNAPFDPPTE